MNIALVMPRYGQFTAVGATSIDLCVRDFVRHSRHRADTTVVAPQVDQPFDGIDTAPTGPRFEHHRPRIRRLVRRIRALGPALIVVHQHLRTASAIAQAFPRTPVLLHTHNFERSPEGRLDAARRHRRYQRLAGIVFVSEACRAAFNQAWPDVSRPLFVAYNGLDFSGWRPEAQKDRTILLAGRLAAEKGVLPLVAALARTLRNDDWRAILIGSEAWREPRVAAAVRHGLKRLGDRATLMEDQPHQVVQRHYERAAIAVVPSRYPEPFGRTALEAFAGCAALTTSGTGGLPEVVGDCALIAPCSAAALASDLRSLMADEIARKSLAERGARRARLMFDIRGRSAQLDCIYERWLA